MFWALARHLYVTGWIIIILIVRVLEPAHQRLSFIDALLTDFKLLLADHETAEVLLALFSLRSFGLLNWYVQSRLNYWLTCDHLFFYRALRLIPRCNRLLLNFSCCKKRLLLSLL